MSRTQHDVQNDHFGVLDAAQLAGGTATSGYAPISNGDGTSTWGPAGGGGLVNIVDDDSSFPAHQGVAFTTGKSAVLSNGATTTDGAFVEVTGSLAQMVSYAAGSPDTEGFISLGNDGHVHLEGSDATFQQYIDFAPGQWIEITSTTLDHVTSWANLYVEADVGHIEMYASSDVLMSPNGHVDARGAGGLFFFPQHAADPTGVEGGSYYNTATHKFRGYANGAWVDLN